MTHIPPADSGPVTSPGPEQRLLTLAHGPAEAPGAALRASEESYRAIFEGAADAIYILHPATGAILDANPAACEMNGYPVEELRRLGIGGVSTGEFPFTWENALALIHLAASGVPQRLEWSARHSSGRPIWGDVTLRRVTILGEDRVLATARDITERKAAEEALQRANAELERRVEERTAELALANGALESEIAEHREARRELQEREEHFRRLIENASDMVQLIDATGRIRYTGPSVHHLLGYTPEEIAGTDPMVYIHPEDQQETATALGEMLANPGVTRVARYRVLHKEGHYRYFEAFARTLSSDSAAEGVVVNARDVTERVEAEAELERQRAYFEQLIVSVDAGIAAWDAAGRVEYISPGASFDSAMRRWIIGRTHHEYCEKRGLPSSLADLRQQPLTRALESRAPTEFEETLHRPDGSTRRVLRRYVPVLGRAGDVERVIGYSIDITERNRAEEALRQASEEAERARDAAERANRAKSEFLSRMSHELRTPLHSILGFAQLLDRAPLPPEHRKGVGHILKAGHHLLQLINEVLEIARIEAGRHSLSLEPVRISSVLQEAVGLMRPLAAQWHVDLDDGPWSCGGAFVHADRQRLTQVLLNLFANAIKYNRPGGRVQVNCETLTTDEERSHLAIRVTDTGRGIPTDKEDQLFTPFARLGAEQSDVEGTGLGLALAHRLTEAMGGTLALESTSPEGSIFRLELVRAEDPAAFLEEVSAPADPLDRAPHRDATILYVEDNLANLSLVETILLARPRWRTIPALQGQLGIELAREHHPDLILLDLHLPDISGEEVLRRLRADGRTAAIPVVVLSADATHRSVERLLATGADAYLAKPLDIDEFMAALGRLLGEDAT